MFEVELSIMRCQHEGFTAINTQAELISITCEIRGKRMGRCKERWRKDGESSIFLPFPFSLTLLIHLVIHPRVEGGCASRNFLIGEKKLHLNGPCKSVASRWRSRITYTVESCYANSQATFRVSSSRYSIGKRVARFLLRIL